MTTKAAFIPEHVLNELTSKLLATGISPMYNNMNSNYEGMVLEFLKSTWIVLE